MSIFSPVFQFVELHVDPKTHHIDSAMFHASSLIRFIFGMTAIIAKLILDPKPHHIPPGPQRFVSGIHSLGPDLSS